MAYTKSGAQTGSQTVLSINTGTVTTPLYTPIYDLLDFSQSGKTNKTADVTNLQSTGEEFIACLLSPGSYDLSLSRNSSDPGQTALLASFNAKTVVLYEIVLPLSLTQTTTGDTYKFTALCEEFEDVSNVKATSQVMTKAKLKVSGSITLTVGS